jgi:hypothetical protein
MTNKSTSHSREEVLDAIRRAPGITADLIQMEVGIKSRQVFKILLALTDEGLIGWTVLPSEPGVRRSPRRGYFIAQRRYVKIPAAWDVLAHFFGRIAAEPAIA